MATPGSHIRHDLKKRPESSIYRSSDAENRERKSTTYPEPRYATLLGTKESPMADSVSRPTERFWPSVKCGDLLSADQMVPNTSLPVASIE